MPIHTGQDTTITGGRTEVLRIERDDSVCHRGRPIGEVRDLHQTVCQAMGQTRQQWAEGGRIIASVGPGGTIEVVAPGIEISFNIETTWVDEHEACDDIIKGALAKWVRLARQGWERG